jgi:hypothetical protein
MRITNIIRASLGLFHPLPIERTPHFLRLNEAEFVRLLPFGNFHLTRECPYVLPQG